MSSNGKLLWFSVLNEKCTIIFIFSSRYDHINNVRWGPIYVEEMTHLREIVLNEFRSGNFDVQ